MVLRASLNLPDDSDYVKINTTEKMGSSLQITKTRAKVLKQLLEKDEYSTMPCFRGILTKVKPGTVMFHNNLIEFGDLRFKPATTTAEEIVFDQLTKLATKILKMEHTIEQKTSHLYAEYVEKVLENECNLWWADLLNKNTFGHQQDYKNSYVLSGGISGGKTSRYIDFCLMIFLNANRVNEKIFLDQATLNYLYKYFATDPTVKICHPLTDNFCATGEAIKWKNISVNFNNNKVQTLENQDYYLFHQWDRTEYAPLIKQKENNTFFI
jgi:hypothetical protein